jgi:hypothetical protein
VPPVQQKIDIRVQRERVMIEITLKDGTKISIDNNVKSLIDTDDNPFCKNCYTRPKSSISSLNFCMECHSDWMEFRNSKRINNP